MNTRRVGVSVRCAIAAFAGFGAERSAAQTESVWTNGLGGNWSEAANWLDGNIATGTTGRAWFTNAIAADCYVNLDASPWTLNSLVLGNGGGYAFALTNGSLNLDGLTPTLAVATNSVATIASVLSGSDLTKDGFGTLILAGPNTYTGATVVSCGTLVNGGATQSCALPIVGAAVFYRFDSAGTLGVDSSGNNSTLVTASGSPAYSADGRYGGALYLNGASTLTTTAFPAALPTGSSPYTIALWEKDNGSTNTGGFVGWGTASTNNAANNLRLEVSNSLKNYWYGNDLVVSGLSVKDGGWHHIAVTWDGYTQRMLVDGTNVASVVRTGLNVGTTSFVVGRTLNDASFKGWIDDLLIANRALSPDEVRSVMGIVNAIPANTVLTVATNATLDLKGSGIAVQNLSGTGTVDTTVSGCLPLLTVNATTDTVFAGAIKNTAGSLSLIKKGTGTLSLASRYNTYAGNTTILEGTLRLAEAAGWNGTIFAPVVVLTNGVLRWGCRDNVRDTAAITLRGGTADLQDQHEYFGGLTMSDKARVTGSSSGWFILNGTNPGDLTTTGTGDAGTIGAKLALASQFGNNLSNRTQTINIVTGTRLTISAPIVDTADGIVFTGAVRKVGGGVLVLSGTNTYRGGTTVSEGIIVVSNSAALGAGPVNLAGGALNIATGTWTMVNAVNAISNATFNTDGSLVLFGAITNSGNLVKTGSGTLVLGGSNSYGGATIVNGGTLQLNVRLPSGTASLWHFNNSGSLGADSSTNGNTLVAAAGAPAYNDNGKFGGALYLDGSSTLTNATFPKGVPTGSSPYTIALWEKDNGSPANGGFVGWGTAGQNNKANNLRFNGNNALLNYWYANDLSVSGLSVNPKDGNWHHIAVTWDGYNQAMYVDGAAVTNTTRTGLSVGTTSFIVGKTLNDVAFKGWMDDLLVASRAFSQSEILSVMGSGYMDATVCALPTNTALTIATGAALDLNGNSQTVASLQGCGSVTGGVLTVTAAIAPGGMNAIGTLTVSGSLSLSKNASIDWNFGDSSAADLVQVNGALTLPSAANVAISRMTGSSAVLPRQAVLFSCSGSIAQTDLSGWKVTCESGVWRVKVLGSQVIAVRQTGTLLSLQ